MFLLDKEHKPPHIHAFYGEMSAAFKIENGEIMKGEFPKIGGNMFNSIKNVIFKENLIIHVEFQNGETKCYDFKTLFERYPIFKELEKNENLYYNGKIDCGGFGIIFNDEIDIAAEEIFNNGILVCKKEISDINMKIANQISLARNKKNLTQTELAKITGIHQAEISKIERGIGNPSIKTLERIAQGLELTLELFLK